MNEMRIRDKEYIEHDRIECFEVKADKEVVDSLLSINTKNRPIVKCNIDFFKNKIKTDKWQRGAAIVTVNKSFTWMLDGQHHLLALKECGYPAVSFLIRIIPNEIAEETFKTMDFGSPRSLSVMLGVEGVKNYSPISSAVSDAMKIGTQGGVRTTPEEALDFIGIYAHLLPRLHIGVSIQLRNGIKKRIPNVVYSSMLRVMTNNETFADKCEAFLLEIQTGKYSNCDVQNPARCIRELSELNGELIQDNSSRICILKAFDSYVKNSSLSKTWRRIEPSDGVIFGTRYFGIKIDVRYMNKHMGKKK